MATYRAHRLSGTTPAADLPKLRVHRVSGAGGQPAPPRLRIHQLTGAGAGAPNVVRLRVHRLAGVGTAAPRVSPITPPGAAEPGSRITLTAQLDGGTPIGTTWRWRRISGPDVTLEPAAEVCSFRVPSVMPDPADPTVPVPLRIGVTATVEGTTSTEAVIEVPVLPQTRWSWTGQAWVGARHAVL